MLWWVDILWGLAQLGAALHRRAGKFKSRAFFMKAYFIVKVYNLCCAKAKVAQEQEVVKGNVSFSRISSNCRDNQLHYRSILIYSQM